ncbi:NADP-dependent oxidoreductase [Sphingomonas koreensis]|nr:NADP-dependent oxidoreductase [Sphingomonas koreensis]
MRAILVRAFGGPEVLTLATLPVPDCGRREVLVRVHAAGVGPWDAWVRGGHSAVAQPLPLVPGSDVSGIVIEAGCDVAGFAPGDAVYGATNARFTNGYAEVAPCNVTMIARKPGALSHVQAASAPVVAVTAWQMLFDHARLTRGERVLIHGAAGNVGRYAVQLARHAGLEILVSASRSDTGWMTDRGVNRVVDIAAPDDSVRAVIDLVGGESQSQLFAWLREGGRFISAVSQPDTALASARGVDAQFILVNVRNDILNELAALFEDGTLKPWVGDILPLSEARAAHEMLAGARTRQPGKIILRP